MIPEIYDIDTDQVAKDLFPPDKRSPGYMAKMKGLLKPLQWARDLILTSFRRGAAAQPIYTPGTYNKYDQVKYNKSVYYSLIDNNTDLPTVTTSWLMIQPNMIGAEERAQYGGTKLLFEWALNVWFDTAFLNPTSYTTAPDYYLPKSDIYLITNEVPVSVFRAGITEDESSSVGLYDSSEAVYDDYDFNNVFGLTIMVPVAVWTALSTVVADRDNIIRNFADKYITAGIFYNIVTY